MRIVLAKTTDAFNRATVFTSLREASGSVARSGHFGEHLGLGYVGGVLAKDHDVRLLYQGDESIVRFARRVLEHRPQVVMATALTATFDSTLTLFRILKAEAPSIVTVVGGDHVSGIPSCVESPAIDFGVLGPGELAARELARAVAGRLDTTGLPGIAYHNVESGLVWNRPSPRGVDVKDLPRPLRTCESVAQSGMSAIFDPPASLARPVGIFYTSRGCSFGCEACSSGLFGKQVQFRDPREVVDEILDAKERFGLASMTFYDLTFNLNRTHLMSLCRLLVDERVNLHWYAMMRLCTPDGSPMLDREELDLMFESGCRKLAFGVESFDDRLLRLYGKANQDPSDVEGLLKLVDEVGIVNRVFLMVGHEDDERSIEATSRYLALYPIHEIKVSILTPFPGTELYSKCSSEGNISTRDWGYYNSEFPVVKPRHFSGPGELLRVRERLYRSFLQSPEYQRRLAEKAKRNPWFDAGIREYLDLCSRKGLLDAA